MINRCCWEENSFGFMLQACTLLGACLTPFSFLTVWELTQSLTASAFAGLLALFGKLFDFKVLGIFHL